MFPKCRVVLDVIYRLRFEDEKSAIDPADLIDGLFGKSADIVLIIGVKNTKATRRLNGGHRCQFAMAAVEGQLLADIDCG